MSEAQARASEALARLEQRVRGELVGARLDGPSQREREARVGMIMAFAASYARAFAEAERAP